MPPAPVGLYGPTSPHSVVHYTSQPPPPHFVSSPADYSGGTLPFGAGGAQHAPLGGGYGPPPVSYGIPHQQYQQHFYSPAFGGGGGGAISAPMLRSPPASSAPSLPSPNGSGGGGYSPYFPSITTPLGYGPPTSPSLSFGPHPLPIRSKLGHASTPSFVPPPPSSNTHRRPGSISLRPPPPLKSPTLSRSGSTSPGLAIGVEREEKKRKIVVRVPREEEGDEEGMGRKRSSMQRCPLDEGAKRRKVEEMARDEEGGDVPLEEDELVSREPHFEEFKMNGLPESIDIYLPGKSAWEEVREMISEEIAERFGETVSLSHMSWLSQLCLIHVVPTGIAHALRPTHVLQPSAIPPRFPLAHLARSRGPPASLPLRLPFRRPNLPPTSLTNRPQHLSRHRSRSLFQRVHGRTSHSELHHARMAVARFHSSPLESGRRPSAGLLPSHAAVRPNFRARLGTLLLDTPFEREG